MSRVKRAVVLFLAILPAFTPAASDRIATAWHRSEGVSLMEHRLVFDALTTAGLSSEALLRWGMPVLACALVILSAILYRNARLRSEVRERRQSEERISALQEQQTRFFALVAHELRSPLGVVVSSLANLRVGLAAADESVQQRIDHIAGATQRLSEQIDRHLRLQRLMRADFALNVEARAPGFPAVLARALIADKHARRAIDFALADDVPGEIAMDTELVTLAIVNLLDNAIKYSAKDSADLPVTLNIGRDPADPAYVVYAVRDHGPGIAPADRERLFDLKLGPSRQGDSGSGIGLALVASIARHHRGRVDCVSPPGGGAIFSLRLPVGLAGGERKAAAARGGAIGAGRMGRYKTRIFSGGTNR